MSADERLDELAVRHLLAPSARISLAKILEILAADPAAPTTVRDPERAVEVHIADSLSALELPCVADARAIADVGSGAGFPGAVLACALAAADVALVESSARKCAFLERLCVDAAIPGARWCTPASRSGGRAWRRATSWWRARWRRSR